MAKFRTKARAVELLGKGQIADLPTAISELWKNGYDAYADNLSCALYLEGYKGNKSPIFLLSDDGIGMSELDILEKWIVLGTDSKSRGLTMTRESDRLGKPPRIPMGEKGIGRLSVAYLGNQMLMLTKKRNHPCQVMFLDWRVLENYNLFIDDLEIPVGEFSNLLELEKLQNHLKEVFKTNLDDKYWPEQKDLKELIKQELELLQLQGFLKDEVLEKFTNSSYHGTTFIIANPHEQLIELADFIDNTQKDKSTITELRRSLSGLYNEFKGDRGFSTQFNIHNHLGVYNILNDFFTSKDLDICDHSIRGRFNEFGFFEGEVRVFDQIFKHTFKPIRSPGPTAYGPFETEIGILEGEQKSSKLSPEQYLNLDKRTRDFGGLYIFRDGFRVLPYGRPENDFLEFEKRRTKSAGYYFFSQRNMLGYIAIGRNSNPKLNDKAGREGFIANKAYREFRDDLIQFFIDLSMTYFKSEGKSNDDKNSRNEQIDEIRKRNEKLLNSEQKKAKLTKKKFREDLKNNNEQVAILEKEVDHLFDTLVAELEKTEIQYNKFIELSEIFDKKKGRLRVLRLKKPVRIKITESQARKYVDFQKNYSSLAHKINNCESKIIDARGRFDIKNLETEFLRKYNYSIREIQSDINAKRSYIKDGFDRLFSDFDAEKQIFTNAFKEQIQQFSINGDKKKEDYKDAIENIEILVGETKNSIDEKFTPLINHVSNLNFDVDDDLLVGWFKEQHEKIQEKLNMTNELAQLGMSVEIIDHQFNVLYSIMSDSISYFKKLSNDNPDAAYYFNQLQSSFQHLERNHKLLAPLYRTTRRSRLVINGYAIKEYLEEFFRAIFDRNRITLTADESFLNYEYYTFESIIKPVFINVINNAVYWLMPAQNRSIHLTVKDDKVLILNNGEPIEERYLEDIFTLFFSRRRDGRGIGLYLAKTNLRSIGYDIKASNERNLNILDGACFIIEPYNN